MSEPKPFYDFQRVYDPDQVAKIPVSVTIAQIDRDHLDKTAEMYGVTVSLLIRAFTRFHKETGQPDIGYVKKIQGPPRNKRTVRKMTGQRCGNCHAYTDSRRANLPPDFPLLCPDCMAEMEAEPWVVETKEKRNSND